MEVRILGPIEVWNGHRLAVGGPTQRRILGALTLHAGSTVSVDRLVDLTWPPGEQPPHAAGNVRTYVSRLRHALGEELAERVEGAPPGYALRLRPGELDADRFETGVDEARRAFDRGAPAEATELLDRALSLWRGRPYDEFADEGWARPDAVRLEQLRLLAEELRLEAALALGRPGDVAAAVGPLVDDHPEREGLRRLQMLALYKAGRQAEALRTFEEYRRMLGEAGIEPSEALVELDRSIARHDVRVPMGGPAIQGYELHERIGEGAFAVVYRGVQPALGREVAIKAIRPELANEPEFIRGFEAEAGTIARLEHPFIVPLYDFWREPDRAFLVMRWLHGGSMRASLQTNTGPWSPERTSRFVEQIGSALQAAHRAHVVHRDVKPANVLLDRDGNTFLADFGIAVERSDDPRSGLSEGSPSYASPEQLRREGVGPATDQYALAMTAYEAVTGRHPFAGASDRHELRQRVLGGDVPTASTIATHLPAGLDEVLRIATAKDPGDRYADVESFAAAFVAAVAAPRTTSTVPPRGPPSTRHETVSNPYCGLRPFQEGDVERFFGRERLVADLLDHLADHRALLLVGPSGSGKSSVVRAGLLPAVWAGALPSAKRWYTTSMHPGPRPFEALALALTRIATERSDVELEQLVDDPRGLERTVRQIVPDDETGVLLLVDQFEELFTHCEDLEVRDRFLDALSDAVTRPDVPLRLVVTLRADFYDHPLRHVGFAALVQRHTLTVPPLAPDELERAVVDPARTCAVSLDPGLTAEIVADVATAPGGLPLMQYLLTELFDRRDGDVMTRRTYEALGGLAGALGRRAEELWFESTSDEQRVVRRVFSRLVTLGEGNEDTRRRIRRSELGTDPEVDPVLDRFGEARLLTFDRDPASREPTVEIAHEALISAWTRLRAWLDEDRSGLRVLRHLTAAADAWIAGGRDEADLFRGGRLESAREWASLHDADINEQEREFLARSETLRQRELEAAAAEVEAKARQNRRLRRAVVGIGVVAVLALVSGALAYQQQRRADVAAASAQAAAFTAETQRMAADATQLADRNPRLALLLAAEAHRREPGVSSLGALQQVLTGLGPLVGFLCGGDRYSRLAWASDEEILAVHQHGVDVVRLDGTRSSAIWISGVRGVWADEHGAVLAADGQVMRLSADHTGVDARRAVGFEPTMLTADGEIVVAGGRSGDVVVLDRQSLEPVAGWAAHPETTFEELGLDDIVREEAQHQPLAAPLGVLALALSDDGTQLASAGWGRARTWNVHDGELTGQFDLVRQTGDGRSVAVPDGIDVSSFADGGGELIVSARFGVHAIDLATGTEQYVTFGQRDTSALEVLSSTSAIRDGLVYSTLSGDTVTVANVDRAQALTFYETSLAETLDVAVSPSGGRLAVAGDDGIAVLALDGDRLIGRAVPRAGVEFPDVRVSMSGDWLTVAVGVEGNPASAWRLDEPPSRLEFGDEFEFVFHNGVGHRAVLWREGGSLVVVDLDSGERFDLPQRADRTSAAAFTQDEALVAVGTFDGEVTVFRLPEAEEVGRFSVGDGLVRNISFDRSGALLAAADADGAASVWSLADGRRTTLSNGGGVIVEVGFLPDGEHLATIAASGAVTIRSASDGYQPTAREFIGNTSAVSFGVGPVFSDDGSRMVTTVDGSARLWDVEQGEQIGAPFPGAGVGIAGASIDGRWLVTTVDDWIVRWDLDVESWPEIACRAAGRNMTADEWTQFGPTNPSRSQACPQYEES